jgi:hypothetical protein
MKDPLMVCYGIGQDSTGVLIGMHARGERPDLILFADVGDERPATYAYLRVINAWLEFVGFPQVTVVRYVPRRFKWWPPYFTLFENCMTNITLPSLAYGGHSCSSKWKIEAQNDYLRTWAPAQEAWARGGKVTKYIGFEDSPHELRRTKRCSTFAVQDEDESKFALRFPLQEWHWDRARCVAEIAATGMPVPPKSSCHFCPAMKPWEVDELPSAQLCRVVIMEARVRDRHLEHAKAKGWPKGVGVPLIEGLWRRRVKGMRGATPKPGSMTEYIRKKQLLPAAQIDALIRLTPTTPIHQADFERQGIRNWADWVERIIATSQSAPVNS